MNLTARLLLAAAFATTLHAQTPATLPPIGPAPEVPAWAKNKDGRISHPHDEHATPPSPQPAGLYVAMGDSITNGTGVSHACAAFPTSPVDIEEYCPDGTSYAILTAKALRKAGVAGAFMNLGIGGAHVERIIADELPYLPANATIVSLYTGTNDSRTIRKPGGDIASAVKQFEANYDQLIAQIHVRAPKARIVLINFPNQKYMAEPNRFPDEVLAIFDQTAQLEDAFINAHYPTLTVADTVCNPASYDLDMRYKSGVHPNEAGAVVLAKTLITAILTPHPPAPPSSCQWFSPAP